MIYHGPSDLSDLQSDVDRAIYTLRDKVKDYTGIVVQGFSGALPGSPVSLALGVPLLVIRKETEDAHSDAHVGWQNLKPGTRWIFLDDFICEGTTLARCQKALSERGATVEALYLCQGGTFETLQRSEPPTYTYMRDDNPADEIPF